ncbi:hypothetical protein C8R44DRAFT_886804 [Mycena epipterygia]|nr:hypothetical protein C8R44DRAFT_886804 [Mycena epipterygia]
MRAGAVIPEHKADERERPAPIIRGHRRCSYVGADDIPASRAWYHGTGVGGARARGTLPLVRALHLLPRVYSLRSLPGNSYGYYRVPSNTRAHTTASAQTVHARTPGALDACALHARLQHCAGPVSTVRTESLVLTPPTQTAVRGASLVFPNQIFPPSCRPPPPLYICICALLAAHISPPSTFIIQYNSRSNNALCRTDRERGLLGGSGYDAGRLCAGAAETWDALEGSWGGPVQAKDGGR